MKVTVIFFGILREKVGGESFEFELSPGATFGDFMVDVGKRFADKFNSDIWNAESNTFNAPIMVVGDKGDLESPDTPLSDGEKIKIVAPLAGG